MRANPFGPVIGEAILGREGEIATLWKKLDSHSVLLTAERRVGKTSVLRKMGDNPRPGWLPMLVFVESVRHPADFVEEIYRNAERLGAGSAGLVWLGRLKTVYKKLAGTEVAGFKLPPLRENWKLLLESLMEDIAEHGRTRAVPPPVYGFVPALMEDIAEHGRMRALLMIDEFPLMVSNIADENGPNLAMEFLDTLRAIRQKFEPSGRIRFLLSGSIGFHLVLNILKREHLYKGTPTNDIETVVLSGMSPDDTELMCRRYLDEEGIRRQGPQEVFQRMFEATDGLPLYVQYVCNEFQEAGRREVKPQDIDETLRTLMDDRQVEWFRNAAERILTYYVKIGAEHLAFVILDMLSDHRDFVPEADVLNHVRSQIEVPYDETAMETLELLLDDNYLVRDTSAGGRRYRFRYNLMREWWRINKG